MKSLEQGFQDYLDHLTGERPSLHPVPASLISALPLYLRERYDLQEAKMFGQNWILAFASPEWELGSPHEYAQHLSKVAAVTGTGPAVIVTPSMPSWSRNRMVHEGIPFIVPGHQLFLPSFAVDLRERAPAPKKTSDRALTPAAQVVLLLHLQKQSLDNLPLREIAGHVGYSAMMITKAKDELEAAGLCEAVRHGKALVLKFHENGRVLWRKAQPKLTSPVRKNHWVRWQRPDHPALEAGLTALSQRTMIEDDAKPTFAMLDATFRSHLERGLFHGCPDASEANVRLQAWSYNPALLGDDRSVDPLSLFLSLREDRDERVQQQLNLLLDQVSW